jgi:Rrf2 family transcriptional regulator, iron-sulfur cluster assembly transcription factor
MQFTKAEEYGIFGVLYLAEKGPKKIVPLSEIAESQDVPEKFLAKIFQNLTKKGIVSSHRGAKGGFSLNKKPSTITIKDVVEAIQGPYHLIRCLYDRDCCEKYDQCPVREVLGKAEVKLLEVFGSYSITDLIKWKENNKAE